MDSANFWTIVLSGRGNTDFVSNWFFDNLHGAWSIANDETVGMSKKGKKTSGAPSADEVCYWPVDSSH